MCVWHSERERVDVPIRMHARLRTLMGPTIPSDVGSNETEQRERDRGKKTYPNQPLNEFVFCCSTSAHLHIQTERVAVFLFDTIHFFDQNFFRLFVCMGIFFLLMYSLTSTLCSLYLLCHVYVHFFFETLALTATTCMHTYNCTCTLTLIHTHTLNGIHTHRQHDIVNTRHTKKKLIPIHHKHIVVFSIHVCTLLNARYSTFPLFFCSANT